MPVSNEGHKCLRGEQPCLIGRAVNSSIFVETLKMGEEDNPLLISVRVTAVSVRASVEAASPLLFNGSVVSTKVTPARDII